MLRFNYLTNKAAVKTHLRLCTIVSSIKSDINLTLHEISAPYTWIMIEQYHLPPQSQVRKAKSKCTAGMQKECVKLAKWLSIGCMEQSLDITAQELARVRDGDRGGAGS